MNTMQKMALMVTLCSTLAACNAPAPIRQDRRTPVVKTSATEVSARREPQVTPPAPSTAQVTSATEVASVTSVAVAKTEPQANSTVATASVALVTSNVEVIVGTAAQRTVETIRGVTGEDLEYHASSAFAEIHAEQRRRWYNVTSREIIEIEAGQSVRMPDSSVLGPLNAHPDELNDPEWTRTGRFVVVMFHLDDQENTNPLGCEFDAQGNLLRLKACEMLLFHKASLSMRNIILRPVLQVVYRDPSGHNGYNVALVFSWSNRIVAKWALGFLSGYNFRISDTLAAPEDTANTPIPEDNWVTSVTRNAFKALRLITEDNQGKPEVTEVHRRAVTLRHWRVGVTVKQMHAQSCKDNPDPNCNPHMGEPGAPTCREECAYNERYNFREGDLRPEDFMRHMPNGQRTQEHISNNFN